MIRKFIVFFILLKLISLIVGQGNSAELELNDFDDDDDVSDTFLLQRPPYKMDPPYENPYKPVSKHKRKKVKPQHFPSTTESLCVRNLKKKKAEEELENPTKKVVPSGNRWHGPVQYGEFSWKNKQHKGRRTSIRAISPVERKMHKCYKWVKYVTHIHLISIL